MEDKRFSKTLAPLHYALAFQNAEKKPKYENFLKDLGLNGEPDEDILGPGLFPEAKRAKAPQRAAKPVEVEGDEWGEDETVVDLMAEKQKREATRQE